MKTLSNAATLFFLPLVILFTVSLASQVVAQTQNDVIVNEFIANPTVGKEYVELLVVASGGFNLQGYRISDVGTKGGAGAATEGHLDFPVAGYLSSLPRGTRVVVVLQTPVANANTYGSEDTDPSDSLLILFSDTLGGSLIHTGTMDISTNENIQLLTNGTGSATTIDFVGAGSNSSSANFGDAIWVQGTTPSSTSNAIQYFRNNTCSGLNNDTSAVGWQWNQPLGDATPGAKNTGQTYPWDPIASGVGTAIMSNNGGGTFNGSTVFPRSTGSQSVLITITGTCVGNLDTVKLAIPATWSGYSAANVTLGGAFTGKSNTGTGNNIKIPAAALGSTPGTIAITGLTSPNPVGAGLSGSDEWAIETASSGSPAVAIASSPASQTIIPISNLRTGGTDGFGNSDAGITPVLNGVVVAIAGVITSPNHVLTDSSSTSIIIQNNGYGMQIFKSTSNTFSTLPLGDSIIVKGSVTGFNGNMEVLPNSVASPDLFDMGASTLPTPVVLTSPADLNESNEGKLVKLNSVTWDSSTFSFISSSNNRGRNNFHISTDSGTAYLNPANTSIIGKTIPASSQIVGTLYHRTDISGNQKLYKLAPRNSIDLGFDPGDGTGTASITPASRFPSQSALIETLVVTGNGTNTLGGVSVTIPATWTWDGTSYALSNAGFSGASGAVSGDGSVSTPWVITVSSAAVTNANTGRVIISNLTSPGALGITTYTVRTKGTGGTAVLSPITTSPTVNITGGFEAIATGNWNSTSVWSGGVVPGASDDVTMGTDSVIVTITANAQCRNLTMTGITSGPSNSGPLLQFSSSGALTLTINGDLSISGGSGGGSGDRGGRAKLNSNGNTSAILIVKGDITSTSSNSDANGHAGLNMNEGTTKLTGATSDTLKNGAGLRLGNLEVGDGVATKTFSWAQTSPNATLNIRSLHVKTNGTFWLGTATTTNISSLGNGSNDTLPHLDGGIIIDNGGALRVQESSSFVTNFINLDGGGITNNGTIDLHSTAFTGKNSPIIPLGELTGCVYNIRLGVTGGLASSNQTISGTSVGDYANITVLATDTMTLNQDMNLAAFDSVALNGTLVETAGNTIHGRVSATRTLSMGVPESFGGIGVVVNAAGAVPGSTVVNRVTEIAQNGSGNSSILRYFDIAPTTNAGLNSSLEYHYDNSELDGQTAATLSLWKSTNSGTSWTFEGGTVNVGNRTVTVSGVDSYSRWTASDASNPLSSTSNNYVVNQNWNMVSLPVSVVDARKIILYPSATSSAFAYEGAYQVKDTLKQGIGYWLKFAAQETVAIIGTEFTLDTVNLAEGWNMMGGLSSPVPIASITQIPGGIVASQYFGYASGYFSEDTLKAGKGYWVKAGTGGGQIVLSSSSALPKNIPVVNPLNEMNSMTITDKNGNRQTLYFGNDGEGTIDAARYEMPPVPPTGIADVRFASQRFVETFSSKSVKNDYPITLSGLIYPVTIAWNVRSAGEERYMLTDGVNGKAIGVKKLEGEGTMTVNKNSGNTLVLKITGAEALPKSFGLSANYPNPFNPSTKFQIALPADAQVEVAVYDILGRKVASLLNDVRPAGYHTIEWNGLAEDRAPVVSGVYFLRMVSGSFNATQKIMLMK